MRSVNPLSRGSRVWLVRVRVGCYRNLAAPSGEDRHDGGQVLRTFVGKAFNKAYWWCVSLPEWRVSCILLPPVCPQCQLATSGLQ